jgi:serine/threonine protein kinase
MIVLQLLDTLRGLAFLHSLKIVHGDIKGVRASCSQFPEVVKSILSNESIHAG